MIPSTSTLRTNGQPVIAATAVAEFSSKLRGALVQPGDATYDEARSIYNAMIDKKPRFIAQCLELP